MHRSKKTTLEARKARNSAIKAIAQRRMADKAQAAVDAAEKHQAAIDAAVVERRAQIEAIRAQRQAKKDGVPCAPLPDKLQAAIDAAILERKAQIELLRAERRAENAGRPRTNLFAVPINKLLPRWKPPVQAGAPLVQAAEVDSTKDAFDNFSSVLHEVACEDESGLASMCESPIVESQEESLFVSQSVLAVDTSLRNRSNKGSKSASISPLGNISPISVTAGRNASPRVVGLGVTSSTSPAPIGKQPSIAASARGTKHPALTINTTSQKRARDQAESISPLAEASPTIAISRRGPLSSTIPSAISIAGLPPIRKKSRVITASSASPKIATSTTISPNPNSSDALPDWYIHARRPDHPQPHERQVWNKLANFKRHIKHWKERSDKPVDLQASIRDIKEELDSLPFLDVSEYALKSTNMLSNNGLPQLFDPQDSADVAYPWYIQTDARILYNNWRYNKIFDGSNILRGIKGMLKVNDMKGGPSIEEAAKIEWRYFGEGNLGNGQWFATQLCAVRDGAHGSPQGGISGIKGQGAVSIVLSGDLYKATDRDEGDEIWYSGTPQKKGETGVTVATRYLMESKESGEPVRVLRSQALPKSNQYKPSHGIRYDGLYNVNAMRPVDSATNHYVFHMVRKGGQHPIRYQGLESKPTEKEIEAFDKDMKGYGKRK